MTELTELFDRLERAAAVLVTVATTQGSAPREVGAWMAVWPDGQVGSIGGGQLEWQALAHARAVLAGDAFEKFVDDDFATPRATMVKSVMI